MVWKTASYNGVIKKVSALLDVLWVAGFGMGWSQY
jgi:hypothetical protein